MLPLTLLLAAVPTHAQVERLRVPAGGTAAIACAEPEEVAPERRKLCQIVAEKPSGDAVLVVPEPSRVLGLVAGSLVLGWLARRSESCEN